MTPALTSTTFTSDDYFELGHRFAGSDISIASKSEMERIAVMLTRPSKSQSHENGRFGKPILLMQGVG